MINWELCKKSKFDHTNKSYMHNPTSILDNKTHKLQWNFDIISARRPELIIIPPPQTQGICRIVDFVVPADRVRLKRKRMISISTSLGIEKLKHESDDYINCNWCSWHSHQRIIKGTGGIGNQRASGDHLNYCFIEIGQNTEKSPGDSNCSERPSAYSGAKNSQGEKIIIIIIIISHLFPFL